MRCVDDSGVDDMENKVQATDKYRQSNKAKQSQAMSARQARVDEDISATMSS